MIQPLDAVQQGLLVLGGLADLGSGGAEVLRKQPLAHITNGIARDVVFGLDDDVAFGIQSH